MLATSTDFDFEGSVIAFRPWLRGIARRTLPRDLRRRLDESDVVQETLARAVRSKSEFRGTTSGELACWLRKILVNLLADEVRHKVGMQEIGVEADQFWLGRRDHREPSSSTRLRQADRKTALTVALESLNEDQRLAVELRSDGLSFDEIGRRLDRSADAASMLWSRALNQLARKLKSDE